jgi:hypothetical protein
MHALGIGAKSDKVSDVAVSKFAGKRANNHSCILLMVKRILIMLDHDVLDDAMRVDLARPLKKHSE